MKGWHFLPADRRLTHGDGREVRVGETLKVGGELELCTRGLHASVDIIDALKYAPGPIVCRVVLGGTIIRDDDKCVASERTVLWMYDATDVLRKFACMCALDVIRLWDAPDTVVRYLKTGDESLRAAARAVARAAAWAAARAAAGAAADAAAWAAAGDDTDAAAGAAARAAARAAATAASAAWDDTDAARAAVWKNQSPRLLRMVWAKRPEGKGEAGPCTLP